MTDLNSQSSDQDVKELAVLPTTPPPPLFNYLGFKYTGIELRNEQVESNRNQGLNILEVNNQPQWYCGDSEKVLTELMPEYDLIFSCPPYANLEVYSDLKEDLSNMDYEDFKIKNKSKNGN